SRTPSTIVPFVLPQSVTRMPCGRTRTSQCILETVGSERRRWFAGAPPTRASPSVTAMRVPFEGPSTTTRPIDMMESVWPASSADTRSVSSVSRSDTTASLTASIAGVVALHHGLAVRIGALVGELLSAGALVVVGPDLVLADVAGVAVDRVG